MERGRHVDSLSMRSRGRRGAVVILRSPLDSQGMEKVLTTPTARSLRTGFAQVERYSWEDSAARVHQVYSEVLARSEV